jgi:hypothetical protein
LIWSSGVVSASAPKSAEVRPVMVDLRSDQTAYPEEPMRGNLSGCVPQTEKLSLPK